MTERSCSCGHWDELLNDPFVPIWYDSKMNEYMIIHGEITSGGMVIYYCLFCGGKMPESRRGDFFTIPSKEELAEARSILERITDVDTMRSILGEPDEVFEWFKDESGNLLKNLNDLTFKCQYRYRSRWKTVVITIQELENGRLRFYFHGQEKESDNATWN